MIPFRPLSGQPLVYFGLFVSSALAALQNVTVDDAVLSGAVVPQYLPSQSNWNVGNTCTGCFVQPDPTLAYNGTWHDATYSPTNGYSQAIQFSFTGSALYIFFILANNVTYATTFTDVEFVLDNGIAVTYTHTPGATTDYQYNVPVYANESLGSGQHNMMIQPVNSGNNVLILFDYLIYTTDTSSSVSPSGTATSNSPSPSATSTGSQGTSSGPNIGAIVGGAAGGVAALVLVIVSLLCYRRHKRRKDGRPVAGEAEPFYSPVEMATSSLVGPTSTIHPKRSPFAEVATPPLVGATSSIHLVRSPFVESASSSTPSIVALQPLILPASTTEPSSSGAQPSTNPDLVEQVEQLRDEVARLRELHDAPPEYSTNQVE